MAFDPKSPPGKLQNKPISRAYGSIMSFWEAYEKWWKTEYKGNTQSSGTTFWLNAALPNKLEMRR